MCRFLSENATQTPERTHLLPGDLVWREPSPEAVRLWWDEQGVAGLAWFDAPTGVDFDLRRDLSWNGAVAASMLSWSEEERLAHAEAYPRFIEIENIDVWADEVRQPRAAEPGDGRWLTATAFEDDAGRIDALAARGFRATRHFTSVYRIELERFDARAEPTDGVVRSVAPSESRARVEVHRDAWIGSSWTVERYEALRESPLYEPELDLVVETTSGALACCCLGWADRVSGIGHFEPVGTRPAWRGRRLTRAMLREGLRRMQALGLTMARMETAGFNAPAQALYESCGFERAGIIRTFAQQLP